MIRIAQQKFEQCEREGKQRSSEICPCTTVHRLVGEIKEKVEFNNPVMQKKEHATRHAPPALSPTAV